MAQKIITTRLNDLPALASQVAREMTGGKILALVGPLGSGKTTFTQLLAKELGISKPVTSPTFALVQSYPFPKSSPLAYLHHLDLYRTNSTKEVRALGLADLLADTNSITVIEWAEKIKNLLPAKTQFIYFQPHDI